MTGEKGSDDSVSETSQTTLGVFSFPHEQSSASKDSAATLFLQTLAISLLQAGFSWTGKWFQGLKCDYKVVPFRLPSGICKIAKCFWWDCRKIAK